VEGKRGKGLQIKLKNLSEENEEINQVWWGTKGRGDQGKGKKDKLEEKGVEGVKHSEKRCRWTVTNWGFQNKTEWEFWARTPRRGEKEKKAVLHVGAMVKGRPSPEKNTSGLGGSVDRSFNGRGKVKTNGTQRGVSKRHENGKPKSTACVCCGTGKGGTWLFLERVHVPSFPAGGGKIRKGTASPWTERGPVNERPGLSKANLRWGRVVKEILEEKRPPGAPVMRGTRRRRCGPVGQERIS